jgi:SprT-like protein
MTDLQLQHLVEEWSLESFGRPFSHRVFFNKRLRTTGGRYHLQDHHIDINPKMLTEFDEQNLKRVVLHELCHYHLHMMGKDYQHRSSAFKTLLKQVGGARYAPTMQTKVKKVTRIVYQCQHCGAVVTRRRHFNVRRYRCAKCGGRFKLLTED